MLIQKAIDATLEIWKDALNGKEADSDSRETLEYMIDAVTNSNRLHKELEKFKERNVSLIQINSSMFTMIKQWMNVLENTPIDNKNIGRVMISKEDLAVVKKSLVNAGYKF